MNMIEIAFILSLVAILLAYLGRGMIFGLSMYAFEKCQKKGIDVSKKE